MNVNWFGSTCRRGRRLARLAAAGCLSDPERAWLKQHTGHCSECRYYSAELATVSELLDAWKQSTPETVLTPELSTQWRKAIEAENKAAPTSVSPGASATEGHWLPWLGLERAIPASLVLVWLLAIGFHLQTPKLEPAGDSAPSLSAQELRVALEWLIREKKRAPETPVSNGKSTGSVRTGEGVAHLRTVPPPRGRSLLHPPGPGPAWTEILGKTKFSDSETA